MCKWGPIQPYLGHEVRTIKETKESYYNLEITWVATFFFVSRIKRLHGKQALNRFCNILLPSLLLMAKHGFNIKGSILFC
jgi:hypothetical protein